MRRAITVPRQAPLRLLFVVDSTFPGLGGAEIQALNLARALRERGAQVHFLAPRVLPSQPLHEVLDDFPVDRIDYPHIRYLGTLVLLWRFGSYLIHQREHHDFIHVHITRLLSAVAAALRGVTGLPVITKISGFFEFEGGVLDPRRRFMPINLVLRLLLHRVDYVQTISEQTRRKLLAAGFQSRQIRFIPNGIDTRTSASELPDKSVLHIGYCGRLREVKGVHVLLDALAEAIAIRPGARMHLCVAGDGEVADALALQASRLGIAQQVSFIGKIDDTAAFFGAIDLYVQPSFAEGLPNSVMEAMQAGRPVLATRIGGNQDLVTDAVNGRLFEPGNSAELAALLLQCLDERDRLGEMGRAGRESIRTRYGFDRIADELLKVYRG